MPHDLTTAQARLLELAERWAGPPVSERAAFQSWLLDFCDALGVDKPVPPSPDYQFELPVRVIDRLGTPATNFIDLWKTGHFALEAKASGVPEENDGPLRRAFGQVRHYATQVPGPSPVFLMTVDVPRTLIVWEGWNRDWGGFPAGRRIPLATLHERPDDIRLLQDIWTNPAARDPRGRRQQGVPRDLFIAAVQPILHRPAGHNVVALRVVVTGKKDSAPSTATFELVDRYDTEPA